MVTPVHGLVGLIALAFWAMGCDSKKDKKPYQAPKKSEPQYELYKKLLDAGVSHEEMDCGIEKHPELNPNHPFYDLGYKTMGVPKPPYSFAVPKAQDGEIREEELVAVALDKYSAHRDNKKLREIVQQTLPKLSAAYYSLSEAGRNENIEKLGINMGCVADPFLRRVAQYDPQNVKGLLWSAACSPDPYRAEQIAKSIQKTQPFNAPAHREEGLALYLQGKTEDAAKALGKSLILDEKDAKTHYGLALVKYAVHDAKAAVEHLQDSIKIDPKCLRAWMFLGLIFEAQGEAEKAKNCLDTALSLKKNPLDIPRAYYEHILRQHLVLDENIKGDYLQTWPSNIPVYEARISQLLEQSGNKIVSNYQDAKAHFALGIAYFLLGKGDSLEQAVKSFQKAIELDPKFRDAYYLLSMALVKSGDFEGSFDLLRTPILLEGNNKKLTMAFMDYKSSAEHHKRPN